MSNDIRPVFVVDGKQFDTKAEAVDYQRRPKIRTALLAVTAGKAELTDWLIENRESVEIAFETGTIRRVTKSEKKKLEKAIDEMRKIPHDPKIAFILDNLDAVKDSFRWPSVNRMTDEQKAVAAKKSLVEATEGREDLADWILSNKDAILAAYEAGVEKRVVSDKATEGLAAYRAKKAAEKLAKEAAKAETAAA